MQDTSAPFNLDAFNPVNLALNWSFEFHSAGAAGVPDSWALEGTPTLVTDTGDIGYGAVSQKITATGAALEGINLTLAGLKALTTYYVTVRVRVTAGDTATMLTTGAGVDMPAVVSAGVAWTTIRGQFTVDAAGTAVVLKLMATADTDVVWFDGVQVNEGLALAAYERPVEYSDVRSDIGAFTKDISVDAAQAITGLGFRPRALIVFGCINNAITAFWGFINTTDEQCIVTPNAGAYVAGDYQPTVVMVISTAAGAYTSMAFTSFDPDGFTVTWTKTGLPVGTAAVTYLALR